MWQGRTEETPPQSCTCFKLCFLSFFFFSGWPAPSLLEIDYKDVKAVFNRGTKAKPGRRPRELRETSVWRRKECQAF